MASRAMIWSLAALTLSLTALGVNIYTFSRARHNFNETVRRAGFSEGYTLGYLRGLEQKEMEWKYYNGRTATGDTVSAWTYGVAEGETLHAWLKTP